MVSIIRIIVTYLTLLMIQFVLPKYLNFSDIYPNFIMMFVVFIAFNKDSMKGQLTGFIYGLTWDVLSTDIFGVRTLTLTICGFLAGKFNKKLNKDQALVQVIIMFVCLVITQILLAFLYVINPTDFGNRTLVVTYSSLVSVIITLLLTPFVFKLLNYIYKTK